MLRSLVALGLLLALPASTTITGVALLGAAGINMSATPPTTCCEKSHLGKIDAFLAARGGRRYNLSSPI